MSEPGRPKGRPRASGDQICDRCDHGTPRIKVHWPEGAICGACYETAGTTQGTCAGCGVQRLLPGLDADRRPICVDCAGIDADYFCSRCGREERKFRRGLCATCALTDDLTTILVPQGDGIRQRMIEALASADRPQSVIVYAETIRRRSKADTGANPASG
jgi:hypothetical protein